MIKSMTGYGEAQDTFDMPSGESFAINLSIRSVNGKGLDLSLKGGVDGDKFFALKHLQEKVHRGTVFIDFRLMGDPPDPIDAYLAFKDEVKKRGLSENEALFLFKNFGLREWDEVTSISLSEVSFLLFKALERFDESRIKEGESIKVALDTASIRIVELIERVRLENERQKQQLIGIIETVSAKFSIDVAKRCEGEVINLVKRYVIDEEMNRLREVIDLFVATIFSSDSGQGKKLYFIANEIMREAGSLASKVGGVFAIELKELADNIKEQVMNVE